MTLPWHHHQVINAAVILDGTLDLYLKNGTKRRYESGDALIEVVNRLHMGRAIGNKDVHLIVFYAGKKDS